LINAPVSLFQIGKSLFDEEGSQLVQGLCAKAKAKGVTLHIPVDFITASKFADDAEASYMHVYINFFLFKFRAELWQPRKFTAMIFLHFHLQR